MANIQIELSHEVINGQPVTFVAPCDCSQIGGLKVTYPDGSKEFTFKDAHGNDLTGVGNLFAKDALIKAILDVTNGYAYLQNADTNAYLENKLNYAVKKAEDAEAAANDAVSISHKWEGTTLVVSSNAGTSSADLKGEKGDTGPQGPQGPAGANGSNGTTPTIKAAAGNYIGSVGTPSVSASTSGTTTTFTFNYLKGDKGDKGDTGATGSQGPKGATGATGATGPQGPKGADGVGIATALYSGYNTGTVTVSGWNTYHTFVVVCTPTNDNGGHTYSKCTMTIPKAAITTTKVWYQVADEAIYTKWHVHHSGDTVYFTDSNGDGGIYYVYGIR